MKTIIIYKSKTGYTKQYAKWLSEAVGGEMVPLNKMGKVNFANYDTIVYGGGIFASKISGLIPFVKKVSTLTNKKIAIFSVGAAASSPEVLETIRQKNMTDVTLKAPIFYMQGGFDPNKLNFFMKFMLKSVAKNMQKKAEKTPEALTNDDKMFLAFFQSNNDHSDSANLKELIGYIQG